MIRRGNMNLVAGYSGDSGAGKTQALLQHARRLAATCYVIACDPNDDMPARLHDGSPSGIVRHESIAALTQRLARDARGIHVLPCTDASPVVQLAVELARRGLKVGRDGVERGTPVVVVVDEITTWNEAATHHLGPTLKDLLCRRRHHHVALLYGTQSPRLCHRQIFDRSSELHLFRTEAGDDLQRLRQGGVREALLVKLPTLPKYEAVAYHRGT